MSHSHLPRLSRHRPHLHGQAVSAAALTRTSFPPPQSAPSPTRPESSPPVPPAPEPSSPESLTTPSPPPAKQTRKAVKRRCKVELLRGVGVEDDFYVTPPLLTPPPACLPLPPSPTPTVSPATEQSFSSPISLNYQLYSQLELRIIPPQLRFSTISTPLTSPGPPSLPPLAALVISTPILPAPAPAPSTITSMPTTSEPTSLPPSAAPKRSRTALTALATSEPPSPPLWLEGYVFLTDPDRIICRFCCKRHYNYKWYSHCYLCHMNENKS